MSTDYQLLTTYNRFELHGCKRCGIVTFDRDLHDSVFHATTLAVPVGY